MAARSPFTGGVGASKDCLLTVLFWKFPLQEENIIFQHPHVLPPCIFCVAPHEGWGVATLSVPFITVDSAR